MFSRWANHRNTTDCNDIDADIHPAAPEVCDEIDNDCDLLIDDEDSSLDLSTGAVGYFDEDADGFGVTTSMTTACELPQDHSSVGGDCDDTNAEIHPDADEVCDGVDNNCDDDGTGAGIDGADAVDQTLWYPDGDTDDYGDATAIAITLTSR